VFPVFGPHIRWVAKGRAGTPVGPVVPVCIPEDRHSFILHHGVIWQGTDVDHAVPMAESVQRHCPELCGASFDWGFHSPDNRRRLDGLPEHSVLRKKRLRLAAWRFHSHSFRLLASRERAAPPENPGPDGRSRNGAPHNPRGFERKRPVLPVGCK